MGFPDITCNYRCQAKSLVMMAPNPRSIFLMKSIYDQFHNTKGHLLVKTDTCTDDQGISCFCRNQDFTAAFTKLHYWMNWDIRILIFLGSILMGSSHLCSCLTRCSLVVTSFKINERIFVSISHLSRDRHMSRSLSINQPKSVGRSLEITKRVAYYLPKKSENVT